MADSFMDLPDGKTMISESTNRTHGFTLLEAMVAVAILAIALVGILKANLQGLEVLAETRETTTAALLAANKLAEIEAAGPARWTEFQGDFGEDYPEFTWQMESATTEVEGLVLVTVVVKRNEEDDSSAAKIAALLLAQ